MTHLPASSRPRPRPTARRLLGLGAAAALLAGCGVGRSPDRADDPGTDGSDPIDGASRPLEAIAADVGAPVDGRSAGHLIDVAAWSGTLTLERCGGRRTLIQAGDRYDQAIFPDLDRIADEGLGIGTVADDPEPIEGTPDETCMAETLPELVEAEKVQGEWMETVVIPTWTDGHHRRRADEATACLRDEMGMTADDLPSLDAYVAAVDGRVTGLPPADDAERGAAIAALDDAASTALVTCASDAYQAFSDDLRQARVDFLDRHHDAIASLAEALDADGYTP